MLLDVIEAATAVEPEPWWLSATAPWWAAPVSTLAGALLAWLLAHLTASRTSRDTERREAQALKREAYSALWSAAMEHHRAASFDEHPGRRAAAVRASEAMLMIELVAPEPVREAAYGVIKVMTAGETTGEQRGLAMQAFKVAVRSEMRID